MTTIILSVFLFLAPPMITELPQENDIIYTLDDAKKVLGNVEVLHFEQYEAKATDRVSFIETKFEIKPEREDNGDTFKYSLWMPDRPLEGNWILVSKPGIITGNTALLVYELLQSL